MVFKSEDGKTAQKDDNGMLRGIRLLTHASIRIEGQKIIYLDPFKINGSPHDADIVFVSHSHSDHYSPEDIKKLAKPGTLLVIPGSCASAAVDAGFTNVLAVEPGNDYDAEGLKFSTVPAYNTNKSFHRKDSNWVGYIVNVNDTQYYFAGDTDHIPEMKKIKADVVFLPVGGTYTMTAAEAAEAANTMKPRVAVPVHYGEIVGNERDARNFVNMLDRPIRGVVLK